TRARRKLHDVLTAIRLGTTVDKIGKRGFANGEHHLRPITTLQKLFPKALIENTLRVAEQCRFSMSELRYEYPHELVPKGLTASDHLRALTFKGAQKRWSEGTPEDVNELLEKELALIAELKYEHFFLTVQEIVEYARSKSILCQGRGSAANSAVCYALGITEVDPSRMKVLFERFISKERAEPPDIDVDFEHDRREEVIQHVYEKYGRSRAALAATVICYKRRMAIRDVGKSLGVAPDVIDALAKSMNWFEGDLPRELKRIGFDPNSKLAQQFSTLVNELIGFPRHLSQHVGGFVISEHSLSTLVPLENASMAARTVIQWDKEDLETLGLLKVDCLALGMLSAIRRALNMITQYQKRATPFRMQDIPKEDKTTYDMICRAETVGVFQIESRAQMSTLPKLKPTKYYELVAQIAIVRPGPIQGGMLHAYLRRRQGVEPITYPSEALKKVLERTHGVPLFQEQVMEIAMVAAGFTAGQADKVRRSMAAWQRRGGIEEFKEQLINGMLERGYTQQFANQIYSQIEGFSSYGFPESHAASFAVLAYNSAWLRCHEPAAFCAALLNSYPMGFYAPAQLIADARRNHVVFRPVDVNHSNWECTLEISDQGKPEVRIGMNMIRSLNEKQATAIVAARSQQRFDNTSDLAHRAMLNAKAMDVLSKAGALASLQPARASAVWNALGVERLPGMLAGHAPSESPMKFPKPTEGREILTDYCSTGFSLGRHPLALLRNQLLKLKVRTASELKTLEHGNLVRIAGIVTHRQRPETAKEVM
ncbi:MAG TPA: error-prone DNA polymerase, partial [Steroidobacteraceae bacterium]|nr:error-prone DNA polymerase [Steroidobacteraceae bacterium]